MNQVDKLNEQRRAKNALLIKNKNNRLPYVKFIEQERKFQMLKNPIVVSEILDNSTILKNNDDLISKLDDNLLIVNTILGSRFVEGVRERGEK